MEAKPTFDDVPDFGNSATTIKPGDTAYANGYQYQEMLPAEHQNWFMRHFSRNGNLEQDAIGSVMDELVSLLTAAGLTPDSGSTSQVLNAIKTITPYCLTLTSFVDTTTLGALIAGKLYCFKAAAGATSAPVSTVATYGLLYMSPTHTSSSVACTYFCFAESKEATVSGSPWIGGYTAGTFISWKTMYSAGNVGTGWATALAASATSGSANGIDANTFLSKALSQFIFGDNATGTTKLTSGSLNDITKSGFYLYNGATDYPSGLALGLLIHLQYTDNTAYAVQLAYSATTNSGRYTRCNTNGTWSSWIKVWNATNDGSGSGLDADLWRGTTPGTNWLTVLAYALGNYVPCKPCTLAHTDATIPVILLYRAPYEGTAIAYKECRGTIEIRRGSATATPLNMELDIEATTAYSVNEVCFTQKGASAPSFTFGICTYNSERWLCMYGSTAASAIESVYFSGWMSDSSGPVLVSASSVSSYVADTYITKTSQQYNGNMVPVCSGSVQPSLNADKLDGYDAGHASGNIPISDGTVNTNLNAALVAGLNPSSGNAGSFAIQYIAVAATWLIPAGTYMLANAFYSTDLVTLQLQILNADGSLWGGTGYFQGGLVISDGVHYRLYNNSSSSTQAAIYYRKLAG